MNANLIRRNCEMCGGEFWAHVSRIRRGKGNTCSVRCRCKKASARSADLHRVNPPSPKKAVWNAVASALKNGRLIRSVSCEECGRTRCVLHAHHDDYGKPLSVRWLCVSCHRTWHEQNVPAGLDSHELSLRQVAVGRHLNSIERVAR
jgi:transposase-like protein